MLRVDNLDLYYGDAQALAAVSLEVPEREIVAIVGANGAGKSSLIRTIAGIEYVHHPDLAPTQEMLDAFKKQKGDWAEYERRFLALMTNRRIETTATEQLHNCDCLLCSEHEPDHCHRRLVAEHFQRSWRDVTIVHLT